MVAFSVSRLAWLLLAAAAPAASQLPQIGSIDFYGLRRISPERIRKALHIAEGSALPASKGAMEDKLDGIPGVVASHVEAVCCDGGQVHLFIGLEERGAPHFAARSEPRGDASLPPEIVEAYHSFLESIRGADRAVAEDLTRGHSLLADPTARVIQERFVGLAELHLGALRKVLRESTDENQRAIAAYVIGYFPTKRLVVDDLQLALQDPSPAVRGQAMRALGAIAVLARKDPELGIQVQPTWFVELLNSVVWSDRVRAVEVLLTLSDKRDEQVLRTIEERGMEPLIEMARWKSLRHAIGPFTLFGRVAGLKEQEIQRAWTAGDREKPIQQYLRDRKKRKKDPYYGPPPLPPDYVPPPYPGGVPLPRR